MNKKPFGLSTITILQDFVSKIVGLYPAHLQHNLGKYIALKKAHFLTALSGIEGDYLDFGVFTGSSLAHSIRAYSSINGVDNREYVTQFYGFDSFKGFDENEREFSDHPFFKNENFVSSYEKVIKRISKLEKKYSVKSHIVDGFFKDTLINKNFAIEKVSIVLLDVDLYMATKEALNFLTPYVQNGMIILIDEYGVPFQSKNSPKSALFEWEKVSNFNLSYIASYGMSGAIYLVNTTN
tara:strand:+ start:317 stop:1030 length:714 start_codon:yes stop_codon:yes gene_type:complete